MYKFLRSPVNLWHKGKIISAPIMILLIGFLYFGFSQPKTQAAWVYSAHALAASGITFGEVTQTTVYTSATGNDMSFQVATGRIAAGEEVDTAPTFTFTSSASTATAPMGATMFISLNAVSETPDTTAPTPDPMTFSSAPAATGTSTIAMTATTASDDSTPIEYYFTYTACASNAGSGGTDSGWQTSTTYTDTGLEAGKCYGYSVKARDSEGNETVSSSVSEATTESEGGEEDPIPVEKRIPGGVRLKGGMRLN